METYISLFDAKPEIYTLWQIIDHIPLSISVGLYHNIIRYNVCLEKRGQNDNFSVRGGGVKYIHPEQKKTYFTSQTLHLK